MATISNIEWTEMTWNPVTGCLKVSQGCKHCYAERMAKRLQAMGAERYKNAFKPTLHEDLIELPKRWKKPRVIFVNSMSDLFQDAVPDDFIQRVFVTMQECPQHTFQILTKRSERLRTMASVLRWPSNVWPGARPMRSEWVESIHRQCRRSDVPFFFKQWGGVRKDTTGRQLHGRTYDEMPQVQTVVAERELFPQLCG